ncbi:MAG: isoprenylcysteine carboxylmethyltransferase family protein [Hyphomicrobiales bacterium]|nr:isoprenylcysteine carboxylmethyltransferase family protein [Hyphomicrobiales bacterium]
MTPVSPQQSKPFVPGPNATIDLIWLLWLVSWVAASFWSGRTQRRIGNVETWTYRAAMIAGGILLVPWTERMLEQRPLWDAGRGGYAIVLVMLAGLALVWWARIHLGRLWSSAITRKEDHRIVDNGPYALVRHPIYTGLIIALLATAAADATVTALIGAALVIFGLWLKARSEERFLVTELGSDAYRSYCRRVPMLVPFMTRR